MKKDFIIKNYQYKRSSLYRCYVSSTCNFYGPAPLLNPGIVDLPSVGKSSTQPTAPIEITIKKDGSYLYTNRVNSKAMRKDKLENIIKFILNRQKNPEQSVVISADKKVRYEKVMELLDLLQRNDIYKVGL